MSQTEALSDGGGGTEKEPFTPRTGAVLGVGLSITVVLAVVLVVLMGTSTYDTWGAVIVAPILILISIPMLARQAAREGDRRLFALLVFALLVKLGGAIVRYYVAFDVYEGVADAGVYDASGKEIAARFWSGNFNTGLDPITGTNFIKFATGVLYTFIGPTLLGGFMFFSWLGFLGLFFFYRAFTMTVPEGRARTYALLLFFLPSLVFWPSSIGKEAWMMFSLGIGALGAAHILSSRMTRGLGVLGLGLWLASLPRPHMAGLLAVSLAAAYLFRPIRKELGQLAPVAKGLALVIVGALALFMAAKADQFLREKGIETDQGVTGALGDVAARTTIGGSSFVPSILQSPLRAPIAFGTVLFRPFIFEAHNAQAVFAALETTFLFVLALVRLPWVFGALGLLRRRPYVAFALVYTGLFILAFSSFANFGLLARERVQLFPLFLVLLSVPPRKKREEENPEIRPSEPEPAVRSAAGA